MNNQEPRRAWIIGFFAVLFAIDCLLYFRHAAHFFQADTVFLLYHRAQSITEFLRDFVQLHASGAYRPLSFEIVESLLFPFFGLNPIPYRIPVYAVFFLDTIAVYVLALTISRRHLVSAVAAFFFNVHTASAYTTFDATFLPELQYTLFYIGAVLTYFRYLQTNNRTPRFLSLACFGASLLSKEGAVTLPGVLVVLDLLLGPSSATFSARIIPSFRRAAAHIGLFVVYLAFTVGYLHVMGIDFTKVFERPENPRGGAYYVVLDETVPKNADVALSWAFNLPRGSWGKWQDPPRSVLVFLNAFRFIVVGLGLWLLMKPQRRIILFGTLWFMLTVIPALPLLNHFIPYYLFLPVVGLSLIVGTTLTYLYDRIAANRPVVATTILSAILVTLLFARVGSTFGDIQSNRLLGGSSELALTSLTDLKRLYPTLPPNVLISIDDTAEPIAWDHSWGGLIEMAYERNDISVLYASDGEALIPDGALVPAVIVLKYENRRFVDLTKDFLSNPTRFVSYQEAGRHELRLSASEVVAGESKYSVSVDGAGKKFLRIAYRLDDGPLQMFVTELNDRGEVSFDVGAETKRGLYQFVSFNIVGTREWYRATASIRVR